MSIYLRSPSLHGFCVEFRDGTLDEVEHAVMQLCKLGRVESFRARKEGTEERLSTVVNFGRLDIIFLMPDPPEPGTPVLLAPSIHQ